MGCFRQVFRCLIGPFRREKGRVIEIGPPTNFRKEELPACFSDADTLTSQDSHTPTLDKNETTIEMVSLPSSTKAKMQGHVRRLSARLSYSAPETV